MVVSPIIRLSAAHMPGESIAYAKQRIVQKEVV